MAEICNLNHLPPLTPEILEIASDNDPYLRIRAKEISNIETIHCNQEIQQLIVNMIATMNSANGIGLAAPQIRQSLRIIVFYLPAARDDSVAGGGVPLTVLVTRGSKIMKAVYQFPG
jgi:peptide deformylase